jgi:hypothetical protein
MRDFHQIMDGHTGSSGESNEIVLAHSLQHQKYG